jgi:hypothetical protein
VPLPGGRRRRRRRRRREEFHGYRGEGEVQRTNRQKFEHWVDHRRVRGV